MDKGRKYGFDNWVAIGDAARNVLMSHPNFSESLICSECAVEAGARWPDGHEPSFTYGPCVICGRQRRVVEANNWSWIS